MRGSDNVYFRPGADKRARRGGVLAALVALIALAATPLAGARAAAAGPPQSSDTVRDWNLYAANALINATTAPIPGAGQTPPVSALHLAMVQGAIYDAVNTIDGGYQPYLAGLPPAPASASQAAAVATAAHDVLVGLGIGPCRRCRRSSAIGSTRLYAAALAGIADGQAAVDAGIAAGAAAAAAMLAARATTAATCRSRSRPATTPASGGRRRPGSSTTRSPGSPGSSRSCSRARRSSGRRGRTR